MQQRARMFKTLACLVVSMTAAAALLRWADPTRELAPVRISDQQIVQLAEARVDDAARLAQGRWHDVEIAAGHRNAVEAEALLAASASPDHAHFVVDREGRPYSTSPWRRQVAAGAGPETVRIEVAQRPEGGPMSASQWLCVQALIRTVARRCSHDDTLPLIRLQPAWAQVYGLDQDTVLRLDP